MRRKPLHCLLGVAMLLGIAGAQDPAPGHPRFATDRPNAKLHPLPKEEGVFHFVVFGDRTGGPREGIAVLAQAVADANLIGPDFVITVGDLVNGYNDDAQWQQQAEEYSRTMAALRCPWFPVAGNHDLYYRGKDKARTSHDANFERHFGPLWYAFAHKNCWFVVLHSDEGDPETGERTFGKASAQRMSDAQFAWLEGVLHRARGADHVFVFLHHPRWLGRFESADYGDDWERVHAALRAAGNVTAVFAGHIHRARYDGVRDGIEYFTVASVGASLSADVPRAGFLHQMHLVTVRKERIDVAALPVGAAIDPRGISGQTSDDVARLVKEFRPRPVGRVAFSPEQDLDAECTVELRNPVGRPIEVTVLLAGRDPSFAAQPDHAHVTVPGHATGRLVLTLRRSARPLDAWFAPPALEVRADYLGEGLRVSLPAVTVPVDLDVALPEDTPAEEHALLLDGRTACVAVDGRALALPDGPFTVEGWLCGNDFGGRRGFVNQTESSGFGIFVSGGKPSFLVHVGGRYLTAEAGDAVLRAGTWQHVAGVFDGEEARLYVDGRLAARAAGRGARKTNRLPLLVGADPDGKGRPTSFFAGAIDEVRVSKVARYAGGSFTPARRFAPDADTVLLLHLDRAFGSLTPDAGAQRRHASLVGAAAFGPAAGSSR